MQRTARLVDLPTISERRGNLAFIQNDAQAPFAIRRAYWIHNIPGGAVWHGNAFRETEEIIVALSGSFDVVVHDGSDEQVFALNRSNVGLHVPPMQWRALQNCSTNSVALVIASTEYAETDCIRDFNAFRALHHQ